MLDSKGNLVEFQAHKLDNGELAKGCSDMCEFCNKPLHPLSLSDLQADLVKHAFIHPVLMSVYQIIFYYVNQY